ncbi:MAG: DUF2062 domain-containing protein [Coraliomargaritaceae bacterium]
MHPEEKELVEIKTRRIRRVKKWLRPLPRRANIHRYPILRHFSKAAKKRIYLWSFRTENVLPSIYIGSVLTFLPIYGLQIPLALLFALILRSNLPIFVSLQLITNPFTVLPIWFALFQIGHHALSLFGMETLPLGKTDLELVMQSVKEGIWMQQIERMISVFAQITLGSLIIGLFLGLVLSNIYRMAAQYTQKSYTRLRERIEARRNQN